MKLVRKWLLLVAAVAGACLVAYLLFPFFVSPPFQVPSTASWVRCSKLAYWLAYDVQVKFHAPYEDCVGAAGAILNTHAADGRGIRPNYVRVPIKDGHYLTPRVEDVVSFEKHARSREHRWWFRPDRIQNGEFFGQLGPYAPSIWIDTDRNILYYRVTD